jgi:hypothetical protein
MEDEPTQFSITPTYGIRNQTQWEPPIHTRIDLRLSSAFGDEAETLIDVSGRDILPVFFIQVDLRSVVWGDAKTNLYN